MMANQTSWRQNLFAGIVEFGNLRILRRYSLRLDIEFYNETNEELIRPSLMTGDNPLILHVTLDLRRCGFFFFFLHLC
jgi:hypothetical protein